MLLDFQIIKKDNINEFVVLPYDNFLKIKEIIEDYEDIMALRIAKEIDKNNLGISAEQLLNELNSLSV